MSTYFNISNKIVAREAPTGYTVAFAGPFINVPLATFTISNGQKYAQYYYSLVDSASTTITGNGNLGNSITATINVETTDFVDGVITLTVYLINPALENTSDTAVRRVAIAQYVVALEARTDSFENEACAYSGLTSLEGIEEPASLVMIPSGYSDGTLGSLKPIDGSGDFTFTRGTDIGATRVAEDGYIEKGYENLLLQSNSFDNGVWSGGISLTSGQEGYDGSNNAWLASKAASPYINFSQSVSVSGVWTLSIYAKANTLDSITFRNQTNGDDCDFNLTNGTFSKDGAIESSITLISNGWYRCSATFSGSTSQVALYLGFGNSTAGSVYIQDAQINQGLVAMPYLPTTTTTSVGGILANQPRIDFTGGGCGSLLLEPSRTNELLYSEYFDGWQKISSPTITTNYGISPEGVQNSTRFQTSVGRLNQDVITINNNETFSVYMKGSGTLRIEIGSDNFFPSVTSEWVRYEFKTTQIGGNSSVQIRGNGSPVDVELYGAQYERNSYATSLIPTYGTSVTRAADDVELPTLSSVFDSSGDYTILFEVERLAAPNESQFFYIRSSSFNYITLSAASGGKCEIVLYDGATVASATTPTNSFITSGSIKIAVKISGNNCSAFANGAVLTLNNTNTIPRGFDRYQNNRNHRKHQEVYFSTALSDAELAELTTI